MIDPWEAIQRQIKKKKDEQFVKDAELAKESMPPEIRELIESPGARLLMPSEVEANPQLRVMDALMRAKMQLEDLDEHYRSALIMIRALVITYGVKTDGGHQAFVSNDLLRDAPDCLQVEAVENDELDGHNIVVSPHACEHKAHPN
jgi:hypothetical protein